MDDGDLLRRIQRRQCSFVVTIPMRILHKAGMTQGRVVTFETDGDRIIIIPVKRETSKEDSPGPGKYSKDIARMIESASRKPKSSSKADRLEKLRIK